jgi:hypothetical protein
MNHALVGIIDDPKILSEYVGEGQDCCRSRSADNTLEKRLALDQVTSF